jgi:hypothetical protein
MIKQWHPRIMWDTQYQAIKNFILKHSIPLRQLLSHLSKLALSKNDYKPAKML